MQRHHNKSKFLKKTLLPTFCIALVLCPTVSYAQTSEQRIRRLENEMQTLSKAVFKNGNTQSPNTYKAYNTNSSTQDMASLSLRVNQLETEMRNLTGKIEQQDHTIRQLQEELREALYMNAQKTVAISQHNNAASRFANIEPASGGNVVDNLRHDFKTRKEQTLSALNIDTPRAAGTSYIQVEQVSNTQSQNAVNMAEEKSNENILGSYTVKDTQSEASQYKDVGQEPDGATAAYDTAFSYLRDKNYDEAEKAFQVFLDQYPSHSLVPNAQYWLGETHYVRNNYETAARIFAEGYKNNPEGQKSPDNLLKLGLSLAGMGSRDDACIALFQLKRQFKNTASAPLLSRTDAEISKLSCDG